MASLPAFTDEQKETVHSLLALTVAEMMGRKLEEGDWAAVYCSAKGIPNRGWSNLNIDVMHENLGVEHKMLCYRSKPDIQSACGTTLMHPSATRSIRIETTNADPTEVMGDVLLQYAALIDERRKKVAEQNGTGLAEDMRTGWLLWQESLRSFLYFEEEMSVPDPERFVAEWHESGGGARKASKNLWIYELDTGRKRYSVTTSAGIKIQPYFDVPPPNDPNVYVWHVVGERIDGGLVRVWLTRRTADALQTLLEGELSPDNLARAISDAAALGVEGEVLDAQPNIPVVPLLVPEASYNELVTTIGGVNDEHAFQLVVDRLAASDKT